MDHKKPAYFIFSYAVDYEKPACLIFSLPVDCEVEPHELHKLWVLIPKHGGEVCRPIHVGVDGSYTGTIPIQIPINNGCNCRQLGNQVHGVLVDVLPVQGSLHTVTVRSGKL